MVDWPASEEQDLPAIVEAGWPVWPECLVEPEQGQDRSQPEAAEALESESLSRPSQGW